MSTNDLYENISMFDVDNSSGITKKLDIVKLDYLGAEHLTWEELFSGFDDLKAITFSSGINFVYHLFDMFETAEVIFGCEGVMSYSLQEIMAYQGKLIEKLQKGTSAQRDKLAVIY